MNVGQHTEVTSADRLSFDAEHVASHMAEVIENADTKFSPWKHVFVEGFVPSGFYQALCDAYVEGETLFVEQVHKGDPDIFYGSYRQRLELKVPLNSSADNVHIPEAFRILGQALSSRTFFVALKRAFGEDLVERYGDYVGHRDFYKNMDPTLLVTKHTSNYYLGAHTDRSGKVFTCVFNLAERAGLDHLGTALYTPKQPNFVSNGLVHHNPEKFNTVTTTPFRPNSILIFPRKDGSFHGVDRLTDQTMAGSERRNIQFNFWDWGRRTD